ncbi:MAG: TIGR03790 family protein [Actinobacteria bacterium]|nr:TIGR03790 family protein [Actinomycetota bacterium]
MAGFCRRFCVFLLLALCSSAQAALEPYQVAVLANSSFAGSRELAEYYCRARNIPTSNIISFAMPDGELVARSLYDKSIVPQVRQALEKMPRFRDIHCLVTVRGVPLRIGSAKPTDQERSLLSSLSRNRKLALEELKGLLAQANRLAGLPKPPLADPKKAASRNRGAALVRQTLEAMNLAAEKINSLPESLYKDRVVKDFDQVQQNLFGLASRLERLKSQGPLAATDPRAAELAQLQDQLRRADQQVSQLMRSGVTFARLDQAAAVTRRSRGVLGVIQQLDASVRLINYPYEKSSSSFDSELSLVLADDYPKRGFVINNLCLECPSSSQKQIRTLMVSRIDAPTASIARGLIDMAIAAEARGLSGRSYIDTGWSKARKAGYKNTEKSLLTAAEILTKYSGLPVIVDTRNEVFAEGSCPEAVLYCGWYSLKKYVDAFDWAPGAVGYHIASFELTTLRNPKFTGWATSMLRDGITATLGAVEEPLLASFPPPDRFFTLLLTGRYSLVECFYMTKRFNSWRLVLIGDPLYRPFAGNPRLSISQAEQILNHKLP